MPNKKIVLLTCLFLSIVFSIISFNRVNFDNSVHFVGDTWEYQSMAVNLVKGKKLMTVGAFGDYQQEYKFRPAAATYQPQLDYLIKHGQENNQQTNFYRTPGYVIFLGIIYKLFGVSPLIVKQIQLLLVIFIAASLPYLGFNYWQSRGFTAGIIAGFVFLLEYGQDITENTGITYPSQIMTEILIAFCLLIFVLVFIAWQKRPNWLWSLLLGLATGINLMVKGSTLFIFPLVLIYFTNLVIKKKIKLISLVTYIIGAIVIVAPYSIYASLTNESTILLSTQSNVVVLGGNNEFATDGTWHREGYPPNNEQSFYARSEVKSLPLLNKVAFFYKSHLYLFPKIFLAKIHSGFYLFNYFWLSLSLIILRLIAKRHIDLPPPFIILFLNFFILTLITFGLPRFIQVIDFIFILTAMNYLIEFCQEARKRFNGYIVLALFRASRFW